jgi:hypothetical protein
MSIGALTSVGLALGDSEDFDAALVRYLTLCSLSCRLPHPIEIASSPADGLAVLNACTCTSCVQNYSKTQCMPECRGTLLGPCKIAKYTSNCLDRCGNLHKFQQVGPLYTTHMVPIL